MEYDIKAPRKRKGMPHCDTSERVAKLILTANSDVDEAKLAILANAMMPASKEERDTVFDDWIRERLYEYCERNKLSITVTR